MTLFDSEKMYRKWMDDIADCQDIYNGHVQHTAPFYGGGGGPGGWGGAMVIVPWNFYKKFGDKEILSKYYLRMKKYLDYMQSRCDDNIVMREEKDGWCLGDWCAPNNINLIPEPFVNTYFFIKCCMLTKKSADILGFKEDAEMLSEKIEILKDAFCREYYNSGTHSFHDGIQGADAYALDIGLGDEKTLANLVAHYDSLGEYDTGIFGTDIVTRILFENGYKEVTLLGQNVDSYFWKSPEGEEHNVNFAQLLEMVALISPDMRVRFSTSHPKDISDEVIYTMARHENICKHIHLPVQSGSSIMLEKMRRKYNREWYLERVDKIRSVIPDCGITTDVIAGFCGETVEDHQDTLTLMEKVVFDSAFMFAYSNRPGTLASRKYEDDIPYEEKTRRLNEIIALQGRMSLKSNEKEVGRILKVLVEGPSKKNPDELCGRASSNKMCVFPSRGEKPGDYCEVEVVSVTSATLLCKRID